MLKLFHISVQVSAAFYLGSSVVDSKIVECVATVPRYYHAFRR